MYHRILPKSDARYAGEEPGMIVEPETFRQHLQQLKQLFTILPLSEWAERQQSGKTMPSNACTITLDDGWADNYEYAFPIIQEEQVPATLFAVSDMIGGTQQFWPNRLARLFTHCSQEQLSELNWLAPFWVSRTATLNPEEISAIIQLLKSLPDDVIVNHLSETEVLLGIANGTSQPLVNWQQLREMSNSGLVEIGSHTCNHYRLQQSLDPIVMASEIINSRQRLQDELNKPVDLFCYPNGDVCPEALELVRSHYKAAVTTRSGINSNKTTDLHQLVRIGVHQDISSTSTKFQSRLANWF
ncbi:MAG: polysaccharide deacetylase family protein [Pseudomonadales bacterium]